MLAQLAMCFLVSALGQAPAEASAAWLKAVPGDVDLVIRGRGVEPISRELVDMIKAMSPRAAQAAAPAISQSLDRFRKLGGGVIGDVSWVGLSRLVPAVGPSGPPFAALVLNDDYDGVVKATNNGAAPTLRPQEGGFDEFDSPQGRGPWYAFKGAGFVAIGQDKELIAAIARPKGKAFDAVLTPALAKPFFAGDVGVFVNASQLSTRYADRIAQGRQAFMAALDQAGQKSPNGPSMDAIKDLYGGLFDAIKDADALTLSLDFAPAGLQLSGQLELKPGADSAKGIAASQNSSADLGKLAPGAAFYMYMNMQASTVEKLQNMSLRMISPGGKFGPEMTRAMEQFHALGRIETLSSVSFEHGMRAFNVINATDPKVYVAATEAMLSAMKNSDSPLNFYKEVKIERDAQNYQGVSYTHVVAVFDDEKLAKFGAAGNGGSAASLKAMFGGDSFSYWIGADGKRVLQVTAPTWDEAKVKIDQFLKADAPVGALHSFQAVRSALADRASFMMILSAQGFVRMIVAQLAATLNKPELKDLLNLPKEPAFLGFSSTPTAPSGYEFHFSLPSSVGPVFENGLMPVFQGMQGNVKQ
ncbi:MAG: hypothetical protein P4L85_23240 [Paludisphaera borealis]|uniref:hypothetical protein n=1 Tax=Paludisphaera borealis TaxID=1387353 RepID=UPI002850387A|nr:hypothetical protein [Paludisphaera borealis]MDR3622285.1 hypothetical protein [Paludisphaera borealis]